MLNVKLITPFVLIPDLDTAIGFYAALGFACTFRDTDPDYAFMHADGGALRLLATNDPDAAAAARQHMVYIDLDDVDAFWARTRKFLLTLPEGRVRAPFDQPYGQREVHVLDPGGTLLFFGQPVA